MLDSVLFLRGDDAVLEGDVFCKIDRHSFACTVPGNTVEEDIMHRNTFEAGHIDCFLRIDAGDITESEVTPMGEELRFVVGVCGTATTG